MGEDDAGGMLYRYGAGVACVDGIPLLLLLPLHLCGPSPTTLTKAASVARRVCFANGWLDPERRFFDVRLAQDADNDGAFFVVGTRSELRRRRDRESDGHTWTVDGSVRATVCVSHVSHSSFTLLTELFLDRGPGDGALGDVAATYVFVSKGDRRPRPLPSQLAAALHSQLAAVLPSPLAAAASAPRLPVSRLQLEIVLSHCGLGDGSGGAAHRVASYEWSLRPSDFDFNRHLNQIVAQTLLLDAVQMLAGEGEPVDARCTSLQVQYVHEVPAGTAAVTIHVALDPDGTAAWVCLEASTVDRSAPRRWCIVAVLNFSCLTTGESSANGCTDA
jgi:hypothetical protein